MDGALTGTTTELVGLGVMETKRYSTPKAPGHFESYIGHSFGWGGIVSSLCSGAVGVLYKPNRLMVVIWECQICICQNFSRERKVNTFSSQMIFIEIA